MTETQLVYELHRLIKRRVELKPVVEVDITGRFTKELKEIDKKIVEVRRELSELKTTS